MPETPESEARIVKMQKDIEELKDFMRDNLHDRREAYEERVEKVLSKYPNCVTLWLEIDDIRSLMEIENDLKSAGQPISHTTLWRAAKRLLKAGLIKKVAMKGRSPVHSKKLWAKELNIDEYVGKKFAEQESET